MTPRAFCFWLQGPLELDDSNNPVVLTQAQLEIVRSHLALALNDKTDSKRYPDSVVGTKFCDWLDGFLSSKEGGLSADQVQKIQTRLRDTFANEIDPTFGNRHELQQIHDGARKPPAPDNNPPSRDDDSDNSGNNRRGVLLLC